MFLEKLLGGGNTPMVVQQMRFAQERHRLLAENIANVDTAGYLQRDLDPARFEQQLRDRVKERDGVTKPWEVKFDDILGEANNVRANILFHDGSNQSVEQLMSAAAKNAMKHNMYAELLRTAYGSIKTALSERPTG